MRNLSCMFGTLAYLTISGAAPALAAGTITDGNASLSLFPAGAVPLGNADLRADPGSPDALFQYQWWYRVNSSTAPQTRETLFPIPTSEVYSGNTATLTWLNLGAPGGTFNAQLTATLTDSATPGAVQVAFQMTITEATPGATGPLDVAIFNYIDPSAGGTPANDSVAVIGNPSFSGHLTFTDSATTDFIDSYAVACNAYRVSTFPLVRNSLNDSVADTFTNTGAPAGPADLCVGEEWDLSIAPATSTIIVSAITVNTTIPNPSTWDLNGDACINAFDLAVLLGAWGAPYNALSLAQLLGSWGC